MKMSDFSEAPAIEPILFSYQNVSIIITANVEV